jgi:hypothetical protein
MSNQACDVFTRDDDFGHRIVFNSGIQNNREASNASKASAVAVTKLFPKIFWPSLPGLRFLTFRAKK